MHTTGPNLIVWPELREMYSVDRVEMALEMEQGDEQAALSSSASSAYFSSFRAKSTVWWNLNPRNFGQLINLDTVI